MYLGVLFYALIMHCGVLKIIYKIKVILTFTYVIKITYEM